MIKLQIIYTMDEGQHLANFPLYPHVLESKRNLITFVKQAYYSHISFVDKDKWGVNSKGENLGLPETMAINPIFVKVSCCVITEKGKKNKPLPKWYHKCGGKLYWEDLNPRKPNPYI